MTPTEPEDLAPMGGAWLDHVGWQPRGNDPLTADAFAWADATGVGRGSGAFGYFVNAYIAGARRSPKATGEGQ